MQQQISISLAKPDTMQPIVIPVYSKMYHFVNDNFDCCELQCHLKFRFKFKANILLQINIQQEILAYELPRSALGL